MGPDGHHSRAAASALVRSRTLVQSIFMSWGPPANSAGVAAASVAAASVGTGVSCRGWRKPACGVPVVCAGRCACQDLAIGSQGFYTRRTRKQAQQAMLVRMCKYCTLYVEMLCGCTAPRALPRCTPSCVLLTLKGTGMEMCRGGVSKEQTGLMHSKATHRWQRVLTVTCRHDSGT